MNFRTSRLHSSHFILVFLLKTPPSNFSELLDKNLSMNTNENEEETKQTQHPPRRMTESALADRPTFHNVLQNPVLYAAFHKFMVNNFAEENLLLWSDVEKYRGLFSSISEAKRGSEMRRIFGKFFSENSPFEVNLDWIVKNEVITYMNTENCEPDANIFDKAQEAIYRLMLVELFPAFLKSDQYYVATKTGQSARRTSLFQYPAPRSTIYAYVHTAEKAKTQPPVAGAHRSMRFNSSVSPSKTMQYVTSQRDKWVTYHKMQRRMSKTPNMSERELLRVKADLQKLEQSLVQAKRLSGVMTKLKHQSSNLNHTALISMIQRVTEAASSVLGVEKSSVWFYTNDIRNSLTLYDMYERSKKGHIRGLEVPADTFEKYVPDAPDKEYLTPATAQGQPMGFMYFIGEKFTNPGEALGFLAFTDEANQGRPKGFMEFADLQEGNAMDEHIQNLSRTYSDSLVRNTVLESPIIIKGGKLVGVLCVEHIGFASNKRAWTSEEQEFLVHLSTFVGEFVESMAASMVEKGLNDLVPEILLPNQPEGEINN